MSSENLLFLLNGLWAIVCSSGTLVKKIIEQLSALFYRRRSTLI
jgi:hypothetical protein